MSAVALENQITFGATGLSIQIEEEILGSNRSGASYPPYHISFAENSDAPLETSINETSLREGTSTTMPSEYSHFEWYWVLVLMILFSVSTVILFALAGFGQIIRSFPSILQGLGVTFILSICYTAAFVILSMFHEAIEKTLEQRLRISRRIQRIILRLLTWCWLPAALTAVTLATVGLFSPAFLAELIIKEQKSYKSNNLHGATVAQ